MVYLLQLPDLDRRRRLGHNHPVAWAWDITNFVFWIGIGHAGTLISAILFLTRQKWRTSVNRAAEAMTIFAVMCAGVFPAFHVGRVWMAWFLAPVPNANAIWQNFKSPLLWDVFAVSTYFTVSVIFWYLGLVPDLATMRDRCKPGLRKVLYGIFALGWRGGNRQWNHYEMAYLLLAALSTPLVLSVHSVVSFDFATSIVPGWHTTIFPPYFVAGAIFGGFAMVLTLMIPAREIYGLQDLLTMKHIDNMAKIILLTGTIVGYAYLMELFIAWYSGSKYRVRCLHARAIRTARTSGPTDCMMFCNVISPQIFWFRWARRELVWVVLVVCMFVNAGMWYRALRHHRDHAGPRLPARLLGHVSPDLGRYLDLHRHLRLLPDELPALRALPAGHRHRGSEGRAAGVGSALSTASIRARITEAEVLGPAISRSACPTSPTPTCLIHHGRRSAQTRSRIPR